VKSWISLKHANPISECTVGSTFYIHITSFNTSFDFSSNAVQLTHPLLYVDNYLVQELLVPSNFWEQRLVGFNFVHGNVYIGTLYAVFSEPFKSCSPHGHIDITACL